jgi:hypothetical protein
MFSHRVVNFKFTNLWINLRLRIYDMEVEEEEDEEMFNSSGPLTETTEQNSNY